MEEIFKALWKQATKKQKEAIRAIVDEHFQVVPQEPKKNYRPEAKEVLAFLNAKTGRNYQPVEVNLNMIVCRLKEGATTTECRQVIAKKAREWATDDNMSPYLRPATLFARKNFWQYQGELVEVGDE